MTHTTDISIVIPVYNSAATLNELLREIHDSMNNYSFEVILVDDGSRDGSWNVLEHLKKQYVSTVTAVKLSRNSGQHAAIICGIGYAKGKFIVTMDDDLQHPPKEIPKLIVKQLDSGADVVYGSYIDKRHPYWRNAGSWFVRKSSQVVAGNTPSGSSFRLIRKEVADHLKGHLHSGFIFIDEILHWYTRKIEHVQVEHHERRKGRSTYTRLKLFNLYMDLLINYTAVPLKIMTWSGFFISAITFLFGLKFIYNKIMFGSKPGFTATIVAILFSTSILVLCMGIIGQYLYKLYLIQNKRPSYLIEKVI
ncbi:MAG: glycosyltransferase family 2 protein [Bacteroidia bacterium]